MEEDVSCPDKYPELRPNQGVSLRSKRSCEGSITGEIIAWWRVEDLVGVKHIKFSILISKVKLMQIHSSVESFVDAKETGPFLWACDTGRQRV